MIANITRIRGFTCGLAIALAGCADQGESAVSIDAEAAAEQSAGVNPYWETSLIDHDEIERGRHDASWRQVVEIASHENGDPAAAGPAEQWDDISAERANAGAMRLPLHGEVEGPSVLRAQILLDRAFFSPGIIDGHWGKNTEKAIYWMQNREGLPATGRLDRRTFERLVELAGTEPPVRRHTLTADDVEGPFVQIPEDIYDQAKLDCMCYESLTEKLAERFHTSPELLRKLNPNVDLDALSAGEMLHVPAVRGERPTGVRIARIVVSDRGHYVHAVDERDRIVYHFPSTLGSRYDPSPTGEFRVTSVTEDPWWHYQPSILAHVDDDEPDANIPPGPNSAVGVVWMALSVPHYGIHGTNRPETIGYATSAGCVRLTNWDALFLARSIEDGVPVQFRDT
jgi:lipoprotein-anchoring transpeptidase ErfK/SrfK